MLPWSLRSMADVRAARTEEKIGHSGRDDSTKKRESEEHGQEWLCHKSGSRTRRARFIVPLIGARMLALLAGFAEELWGG